MQANRVTNIFVAITVITLTVSHCFGQVDSLKKECIARLIEVREVYYLGNSIMLDSLYNGFVNSECKKDTVAYLEVLRIMADQRHKQEYLAAEQAIRDEIAATNYSRYSRLKGKYRLYYLTGELAIGRRFSVDGFQSVGVKAGWISRSRVGVEATVRLQNVSSVIDIVDNRDDNGIFRSDGIYFKSSTKSNVLNASVVATWTDLMPNYLSKGLRGVGGFAGFEAVVVNRTRVVDYYQEDNYADSLIGESQHMLTFKVADRPSVPDNEFYVPKATVRAVFGIRQHIINGKFNALICIQYSTATFDRFQVRGFQKDVYAKTDYMVISIAFGIGSLKQFK